MTYIIAVMAALCLPIFGFIAQYGLLKVLGSTDTLQLSLAIAHHRITTTSFSTATDVSLQTAIRLSYNWYSSLRASNTSCIDHKTKEI